MGYSDGYIKTIHDDLVHIHIPSTTISNSNKNDTVDVASDKQLDDTQRAQVPESVLQYERQLRKQKAAKRASAPLSPSQLDIIYNDEHIIVVNKPSGVLSVPGINSNPSMLTLLYEHLQDELDKNMLKEHMIIHRLDMDTSGIVIYAKSKECMSILQNAFRERQVDKVYEALLCGHLDPSMNKIKIDLPLQRDHAFPPFMRIATQKSEEDARKVVKDLNTNGFKKLIKKNAKPSVTLLEVIDREYIHINQINDTNEIDQITKVPVTRVKLEPVTGRTHQLRVHCAALGHPIVGDPAYSLLGEANTNGGLTKDAIEKVIPNTSSIELQMDIENWVKVNDKCMCLHARSLRLEHPVTKKEMLFSKRPDF
jgi:23S rRNA-/tRNA-specific pseudouridylate synthase